MSQPSVVCSLVTRRHEAEKESKLDFKCCIHKWEVFDWSSQYEVQGGIKASGGGHRLFEK